MYVCSRDWYPKVHGPDYQKIAVDLHDVLLVQLLQRASPLLASGYLLSISLSEGRCSGPSALFGTLTTLPPLQRARSFSDRPTLACDCKIHHLTCAALRLLFLPFPLVDETSSSQST
jgi:hypothetical protein